MNSVQSWGRVAASCFHLLCSCIGYVPPKYCMCIRKSSRWWMCCGASWICSFQHCLGSSVLLNKLLRGENASLLWTPSLRFTKTSTLLSCKHHYPTFPPTAPDLLTINCIAMLENPFFFSVWSMNECFKIIRMEMSAYTKLRIVRLLTLLSFSILSNILATGKPQQRSLLPLYFMCNNS